MSALPGLWFDQPGLFVIPLDEPALDDLLATLGRPLDTFEVDGSRFV